MDLVVETREKFGKANRALRRGGVIPAELYGRGLQNVHLAVKTKDFMKVFKEAGENMLIILHLKGEKRPVLIHDVARDYLSGEISHIDFYQVRLDEKIRTHVPIEFVGEAPAVKEKGGFLNKTLTEIEVESLPADLPHALKVALSSLDDLNKSLYVRDLETPRGVKILVAPETVVVTVTPPQKEEEKVEAPVDVTSVKVEAEEKKIERARETQAEESAEPPHEAKRESKKQ